MAVKGNPSQPLSPRECAVLQAVIQYGSNAAVARALGISKSTVENHLTSIYRKLDVRSRSAAIAAAVRRGLVQVD